MRRKTQGKFIQDLTNANSIDVAMFAYWLFEEYTYRTLVKMPNRIRNQLDPRGFKKIPPGVYRRLSSKEGDINGILYGEGSEVFLFRIVARDNCTPRVVDIINQLNDKTITERVNIVYVVAESMKSFSLVTPWCSDACIGESSELDRVKHLDPNYLTSLGGEIDTANDDYHSKKVSQSKNRHDGIKFVNLKLIIPGFDFL